MKDEKLQIRRYEAEDLEVVHLLHDVAMRGAGIHLGDDGAWYDDLREIQGAYLRSGGEFLVGTIGNEVVAMGGVKRTGENRAEIKYIRVNPECQQRGFGRIILDALEKRATELGYEILHLDTAVSQKAARSLYESNGYREIRRDDKGHIECVFYEKSILA